MNKQKRANEKSIMVGAILFLLCILCLAGCSQKETAEIKYLPASKTETTAPALVVVPVVIETPTPSETAVAAVTPAETITPVPVPTETPATAVLSESELQLSGMRAEEKIGQLVMFGFSGTDGVSSEFKTILHKYYIGNVILYGANIDRDRSDGGFSKCRKLTDALRACAHTDIPLLIAIDVEGGKVTRFRWSEKLLSASELGNKNDADLAETQFERIGSGLVKAGINLDLAPVMDIAKKPSSTFLNTRIISSSAAVSGAIGAACIRGLHNSGCLSLIKHFPGHGATANDSHKTTPVINRTLEELQAYELIPFAQAIQAGTDGVMVGHLKYPNIDPDNIASQSYFFITELLREELGFEGIVMSDDFRMEGLRAECPLKEAAVNFILAGGDIILCGPNHEYQQAIMEGLLEAYEDGILTEERIDESVMRICRAKNFE